MKFDCIVLPIIEWDHRFQRPQHIASAFADDGHRVYYTRLVFSGWEAGWSTEKVRENLWRVALPGPADHNRFLQVLPDAAVECCVDALLELSQRERIGEAVILVQQPFWANVALRLAARTGWKIVYDCMDEHDGLTALNADILLDEKALGRRSDLVVSTSRKLASKHEDRARRHVLLPNACEFEHFASPGKAPDPLAGMAGPIIGYYGAIMEWFDLEMMVTAAKLRPDWNFVIIGAIDLEDIDALRSLPNVHLLGEKPYAELPAYLHRFDVALIPFRLIPIIQATNPVKFYEYLSAGKPVVATALPELEPFPEFYELARTGAELVAKCELSMASDSPAKIASRRQWASGQTWAARYAVLRSEIAGLWGKASIVIVSYQNLDKIRDCVESLARHSDYPNQEVIIVDNASTPDVVGFLREWCSAHPMFRLIESAENLGFARGNNVGLATIAADSEYVVLLNNDTVVTANWLHALTRSLADSTVGMAGPVTWPNGSANESAIPVPYQDMDGMHAFAAGRAVEFQGKSFDIPMLAMFCVALRRDVFDQIGPLEEAYGIGMFEDDDYSMRVRQAGLRVVCVMDSFVHHVGRASFGKMQEQAYQDLFKANKAIYEQKWGVKWRRPAARADIGALLASQSGRLPARPAPTPGKPRSVSVVLVNYNGLSHLQACLSSLMALDYPAHLVEVVLVDNASNDDSVAWLAANWPNVVVIANEHNVGFSRACNQATRIAKGELVAFLNNDMRVHPDWLNGLVATMARDEDIACVGSMVMNWEGTFVEYAGRFEDVFSIAYEPLPQTLRPAYSSESYSLFVSGGAMLLDRQTFLDVGGFDERYFMYHEDVDLCWRLWTHGKRCCLAPRSVVYHRGGASSKKLRGDVVLGWGQKHLLWTAIKNFDDASLRRMLPLLIYFLVERGRWSEGSMNSLVDNFEGTLAGLSSILADRARIQEARKTSDSEIFSRCGHPMSFILRSPLFDAMATELATRHPADAIDFTDPGQVAQAMLDWLGAAVGLREEFAPTWQADAVEKYHRVQSFNEAAPPATVFVGSTGGPAGTAPAASTLPSLVQRIRRRFLS